MTFHVSLPHEIADATERTMLLFDLAAGEQDFQAADTILAELLPGQKTQGINGERVTFGEFKITVVPYSFSKVRNEEVHRRLWSAGVISIDPERVAAMPAAPQALVDGQQGFDIIAALGLGGNYPYRGLGITVAVLDSGIAKDHPDFVNRHPTVLKISEFQDGYDDLGHGTHCIGVACGIRPYGIADESKILSVRVYSQNKAPTETRVIQGLQLARDNGANVATLSLNWRPFSNEPSPQLERVGRQLLDVNRILVIASGARSSGDVTPPANCNSIMAIGSVGPNLEVSSFAPHMVAGGDPVDAVAYGENILSACLNSQHCVAYGNSMATALAGGIAAVWAGKNSALRGAKLWEAMVDAATTASLATPQFKYVGAGLLQPPKWP
ncbi:MAG: S8 family serine peptidase [Acidobacteriota bacterium]